MDEILNQETERLIRSWMQHDASHLRDYLVAGVEDPRINLQSIFSRHFLIRAQFGERFSQLMEQEYQFSAVMNWLQEFAGRATTLEEFEVVLHALRMRSDNAEGVLIPGYVVRIFSELPTRIGEIQIPNYVERFFAEAKPGNSQSKLAGQSVNTFQVLWCPELETALPTQGAPGLITILEPACGSANDFRFLARYGVARFIDYTGFDLCPKNIGNARVMFPEIRFEVGNVLEISAPDKAFDFCFVHDLFEHLSLEASEVAARELCRVTSQRICIGFFNMDETPDHLVRPMDEYHWNTLSMAKTQRLFSSCGFAGEAVHIGTFLRSHIGCEHAYNPNAYTFFLSRV